MQTHARMLISQLLSSVNMLFSKTGSFISPFTQKLLSATRLFTGVVLQYDYLSRLRLALTRMQNFFMRNRFRFLIRYLSNHRSMFPKARKEWKGKINCRIHVVQVCLKLVGACNETVYIPVRKH